MAELTPAADEAASSTRFAKAHQDLRNLIIAGHFAPNVRLTEAELTSLLDVSRGTVRAVLVRLVHEGYLTSEPNRGVRTRTFDIDEAIAVLEAREVVEAALAAKAAERATDEELQVLADIFEEMSGAEYARAEATYSGLNRRFHAQVRAMSRQPILSSFIEDLVYPLVMRQYRDQTREHPRRNSLAEHRAILAAVQTRNPEAAHAAMRHHVASARRALVLNAERDRAAGPPDRLHPVPDGA